MRVRMRGQVTREHHMERHVPYTGLDGAIGGAKRRFAWLSWTCSASLLLLAAIPGLAPAQVNPRVAENTRHLLERIDDSPRLLLEMSEFFPRRPERGLRRSIGMVSSVAAGQDGLIYVLHRNLDFDPVVVFDEEGQLLRSWGSGLFKIPHSIRLDPDGNVWTIDAGNSHIYKFTPDGEQILHIDVGDMPPSNPDIDGGFRGATDIAFASDGHLFVTDGYGNARVLEYDSDGRRVNEWGSIGEGPGQFVVPHGIAIDSNDDVYVADRQNGRIQRFDRNGKLLDIWDGLGQVFSIYFDGAVVWAGTNRLDQPNNAVGWVMKLDPANGNVLGVVTVPWAHSLTVNDAGEFLVGLTPNRILWYRGYAKN